MSGVLIRVLHIDDHQKWRSSVLHYLNQDGCFQVTSSVSGKDSLKILQHCPFDVIISDYQMPEMDGIEVLKYIRSQGNTTPFILFTESKSENIQKQFLESGGNFYIMKSGDPDLLFSEICQNIRQVVSLHQTREALIRHRQNEVSFSHF
ncbi:MAG: response regulator [Methanomicrobiales archaeon]|jgi:CheY-like chemotaxis protein|nr:response regulator [Methanomicrobiales archaeon]